MKPVLHRAFLDSPIRISVNWVLSLANRIYMQCLNNLPSKSILIKDK